MEATYLRIPTSKSHPGAKRSSAWEDEHEQHNRAKKVLQINKMYDFLPAIFEKENMMERKNIIKMIEVTLFASVPFVLSASGPRAEDVLDQAGLNETDDRWNPVEELNTVLGENIQKFYDVAIIAPDTTDRYVFNVGRAADSIRDTCCQLRSVMRDDHVINRENFQKMRALIDVLRSRKGLTEDQKKRLGERLDYFEKVFLKEYGTELGPREIAEAPSTLVQVNSKEEWTAFLVKRAKKFLGFVLIHPDICEDNGVYVKWLDGNDTKIKVRKEGFHDVRDPIFWTIRTAGKLGITFDENDLGELCNKMQRLSVRSDLSEKQRMCISNCCVDLQKAIGNNNYPADDAGEAHEELSTLFEKFGERFSKFAISQSHWYEDVRQKLLSTLNTAQQKGIEIKDESFRVFFERCFEAFNHLDRPEFVPTSGTTSNGLKIDVREMLNAIPKDQSLRLGDDYTKIRDYTEIRDLCSES